MDDPTDERGVPISSGIPPIVIYAGFAGVVLIFIVAGMVLANAGFGHVWPAENSVDLKL
jgi:ABC-type phosphate transport system auxiliary subunit